MPRRDVASIRFGDAACEHAYLTDGTTAAAERDGLQAASYDGIEQLRRAERATLVDAPYRGSVTDEGSIVMPDRWWRRIHRRPGSVGNV